MFRWLRRLITRLRVRSILALETYEFISHSCGHGHVALKPGERCPYCDVDASKVLREARRELDEAKEELKQLKRSERK